MLVWVLLPAAVWLHPGPVQATTAAAWRGGVAGKGALFGVAAALVWLGSCSRLVYKQMESATRDEPVRHLCDSIHPPSRDCFRPQSLALTSPVHRRSDRVTSSNTSPSLQRSAMRGHARTAWIFNFNITCQRGGFVLRVQPDSPLTASHH